MITYGPDYSRCFRMLFETDADIANCVLGYIENQLGNKVYQYYKTTIGNFFSETFLEKNCRFLTKLRTTAINGIKNIRITHEFDEVFTFINK